MNPNTIDQALEAHLLAMAGAPPMAWEDVGYTPVTGQAYLQVHQLRNRPIDHAMTLDVREDRGIFQVTVVYPTGRGKVSALALADMVAQHFAIGTSLALAGGGAVTVYASPAIASGMSDGAWYRVPVSISWTTA